MRRLSLAFLVAALTLSACADDAEPDVVESDTVTVVTGPDAAVSDSLGDGDALATADGVDDTPSDASLDAPAPAAPTGPDESALEADAVADVAAAKPPAGAAGVRKVTFFNNTGMSISHLYIAGCDESEGSDWSDMKSWAQERLGGNALDPDESTVIEYADGCYVAEPHYVGGTPISEKVIVDGPTTVDFTIG